MKACYCKAKCSVFTEHTFGITCNSNTYKVHSIPNNR